MGSALGFTLLVHLCLWHASKAIFCLACNVGRFIRGALSVGFHWYFLGSHALVPRSDQIRSDQISFDADRSLQARQKRNGCVKCYGANLVFVDGEST